MPIVMRPDSSEGRSWQQPGMMDDKYWAAFTSDAEDYELGSAIGFGASSTVYSAVFTPPSSHPPPTTPAVMTSTVSPPSPSLLPISSSSPGRDRKPKLSIALPVPSSLPDAASTNPIDFSRSRSRPGSWSAADEEERYCAIKVSGSHTDFEQLFKEIRLLALCRHPNVLRILSTFPLPPDYQRIALVTPLVSGGSLAGILDWRSRLATTPKNHHTFKFALGGKKKEEEEGRGGLDEEEVKGIIKQVLEGLKYLHERGYIHRDLKSGNLLIDEDGTVLLADFGVGGDMNLPPSPTTGKTRRRGIEDVRFDPSTGTGLGPGRAASPLTGDRGMRKSFVGTPNWMAPEVILGQKYDSKADIWSLGVTMLELAYGVVPGAKQKHKDTLTRIVSQPAPTLDRMGKLSKLMKEFVDGCLVKDPASRPTAGQLLDHQWLRNVPKKSLLAQSLLEDVPHLTQRQELKRVPTISSLVSGTSSWDFASPSIPSSPIRSSVILTARSPSVMSKAEYFAPHTHSRSSSFSAIPPSPRVSLRQWAERSGSDGDWIGGTMGKRTGSERGNPRSLTPSQSAKKATSFDLQRPPSISASFRGNEVPSPLRRGREIRAVRSEDAINGNEELQDEKSKMPMSPLLEVSRASGQVSPVKGDIGGVPPLLLSDGLAGLGISKRNVHGSPETLPDPGRDTPESIESGGTTKGKGAYQGKSTPPSPRSETPPKTARQEIPSNEGFPLSRTETFLARISSRTTNPDTQNEKRNWLGRRSSGKKLESMTAAGDEKYISGLDDDDARGEYTVGRSRSGSWGGMLKMTGRKKK